MSKLADRLAALTAAAAVQVSRPTDGSDVVLLQIGDADPIECKDLGAAVRALAGSELFAEVIEVLAAGDDTSDAGEADDDGDTAEGDVTLPETWVSGSRGVCMTEPTGPGRDFTNCTFSWRPMPLPLMMVEENEGGHWGAVWVGVIDEATGRQDGGVDMAGRFFNDAHGRSARDKALAVGKLPVSVDPSEYVTAEFECTEMDEDDFWCIAGKWVFTEYEIAGLTIVPMPGFEDAAIVIAGADGTTASADEPRGGATTRSRMAAAGTPPMVVFYLDEPTDPEDPRLVAQPEQDGSYAGRYAVPLTVLPTRQVFGHLAAWGTCHIGYAGTCVTVPDSPSSYARFHLTTAETAEKVPVVVGAGVVGCDHALHTMRAPQARDHYASTGLAWSSLRVVDGVWGPWVTGWLRDDVTDEQLAVIEGSAFSGDWRDFGGQLDLVAIQLVNTPGFPILRELVASAGMEPAEAKFGYRVEHGRVTSLTAAGVVRRSTEHTEALVAAGTLGPCTGCRDRKQAKVTNDGFAAVNARLDKAISLLHALDARTAHLRSEAAAAALRRIRRG